MLVTRLRWIEVRGATRLYRRSEQRASKPQRGGGGGGGGEFSVQRRESPDTDSSASRSNVVPVEM